MVVSELMLFLRAQLARTLLEATHDISRARNYSLQGDVGWLNLRLLVLHYWQVVLSNDQLCGIRSGGAPYPAHWNIYSRLVDFRIPSLMVDHYTFEIVQVENTIWTMADIVLGPAAL